jgi:hypothetical protein
MESYLFLFVVRRADLIPQILDQQISLPSVKKLHIFTGTKQHIRQANNYAKFGPTNVHASS